MVRQRWAEYVLWSFIVGGAGGAALVSLALGLTGPGAGRGRGLAGRTGQSGAAGRDTHFFDFVNGYRVKEAQRLLSDPALDGVSILAIAHDAGFGSKTSFNRIFKSMTGDTPTVYRRRTGVRGISVPYARPSTAAGRAYGTEMPR